MAEHDSSNTNKPTSTIAVPMTEEMSKRLTLLQTAVQIRTGARPSQGSLVADLINGAYERNADAIQASISLLGKFSL